MTMQVATHAGFSGPFVSIDDFLAADRTFVSALRSGELSPPDAT